MIAAGFSTMVMAADATSSAASANTTPPPTSGNISPTPAATSGNTSGNLEAGNDLTVLEGFLRMSPERIKQLRKALDYLDDMSPEQKAILLRDVTARQNSIIQLQTAIHDDLQTLTPTDRNILAAYERTLLPEELQALIKRFDDAGTNVDARKQIIQEILKTAKDKGIQGTPANLDRPPGGQRGNTPQGGRGRGPAGSNRGGTRPAGAIGTDSKSNPAPSNTTATN
jgi:hypothetical protein